MLLRVTIPVSALNGVLSGADGRVHRCHIMDAAFLYLPTDAFNLSMYMMSPPSVLWVPESPPFGVFCGHTRRGHTEATPHTSILK